MEFAEWQRLTDLEQRAIASTWSPQDTSAIEPLLNKITNAFRQAYPEYDVRGPGNVFGSLMLVVMQPFISDKRGAPDCFMGLGIRYTLAEPVPEDFEVHTSYVWAPENFLNFVHNHAAEIREALGDPTIEKEEMLDALVGKSFDEWIEQCKQFGPEYTDMEPGQRTLDE